MSRITEDFDREIARCERELAAMWAQPEGQPAYLTTLGIHDWEREREFLQRAREQRGDVYEVR